MNSKELSITTGIPRRFIDDFVKKYGNTKKGSQHDWDKLIPEIKEEWERKQDIKRATKAYNDIYHPKRQRPTDYDSDQIEWVELTYTGGHKGKPKLIGRYPEDEWGIVEKFITKKLHLKDEYEVAIEKMEHKVKNKEKLDKFLLDIANSYSFENYYSIKNTLKKERLTNQPTIEELEKEPEFSPEKNVDNSIWIRKIRKDWNIWDYEDTLDYEATYKIEVSNNFVHGKKRRVRERRMTDDVMEKKQEEIENYYDTMVIKFHSTKIEELKLYYTRKLEETKTELHEIEKKLNLKEQEFIDCLKSYREKKELYDKQYEKECKKNKLLICGSRTITDKGMIFKAIENFIKDTSQLETEKLIILEGGAKGVDSITKEFAINNKITYEEHKHKGKKSGHNAGIVRNTDMLEACDFCLIIWDGLSEGTKHAYDFCNDMRIPYRYINEQGNKIKDEYFRESNILKDLLKTNESKALGNCNIQIQMIKKEIRNNELEQEHIQKKISELDTILIRNNSLLHN